MADVDVRIVTSRDEGTVGAVHFGPYYLGNYRAFWWEVEHLDEHRATATRLKAEAKDARPSEAAWRKQQAADRADYVKTLTAAAPRAAAAFDQMAALGMAVEFFGGPDGYRPAPAHVAARAAAKE